MSRGGTGHNVRNRSVRLGVETRRFCAGKRPALAAKNRPSEGLLLGQPLWDNKSTKMKTQKCVDFRGNYFCIFFFVCASLWAGQINQKAYKNETEVRGTSAIQVSSPPV